MNMCFYACVVITDGRWVYSELIMWVMADKIVERERGRECPVFAQF